MSAFVFGIACFIGAALGTMAGAGLNDAFQIRRYRRIAREEIIDFTIMRSGLGRDNDEWQRRSLKADWDRFRTSVSQQGQSDA